MFTSKHPTRWLLTMLVHFFICYRTPPIVQTRKNVKLLSLSLVHQL